MHPYIKRISAKNDSSQHQMLHTLSSQKVISVDFLNTSRSITFCPFQCRSNNNEFNTTHQHRRLLSPTFSPLLDRCPAKFRRLAIYVSSGHKYNWRLSAPPQKSNDWRHTPLSCVITFTQQINDHLNGKIKMAPRFIDLLKRWPWNSAIRPAGWKDAAINRRFCDCETDGEHRVNTQLGVWRTTGSGSSSLRRWSVCFLGEWKQWKA